MEVIIGLVSVALGAGIGIYLYKLQAKKAVDSASHRATDLVQQAELKAQQRSSETITSAQKHADELRAQVQRELDAVRSEHERREKSLVGLQETVESRAGSLDRREGQLDRREEKSLERERELEHHRAQVAHHVERHRKALEQVAGLSAQQAKDQLIEDMKDEAKRDAMATVRDYETQAREEAERRARKIVVTAIQRLGSDQAQEASVSIMQLPSEDLKGRIIGREGRNIRHFEQTTGVNLVVDDTPDSVLLSCFDPVRREVARLTLEALVSDGRIHPARIEEQFARAHAQVETEIKSAGEDAILDVGLTNVNPELVRALGRLRFRYSYGQNVLKHVIEAAHIAGMIASELGSDIKLAKRATLFHDIGKAVAHEVEGSHAFVGAELARRLGESGPVVHAIEAHHGEIEPKTLEAVIAQASDAISGARPGARRESFEAYVKRLQRLEEIAKGFGGVDKVYAMQAGREVRVMVSPGDVDDVGAQIMAREIAKKIEEELQYPGQIRVVVLREIRSVEYAR